MSSDFTSPTNPTTIGLRASQSGRFMACAAAALAILLILGGALLYLRRPPLVGAVAIVVHPADAAIIFDGKSLGNAPQTIENVAAGLHTIRVFKEGYILLERTIYIEDGQTLDISGLVLKPMKSDAEATPTAGTPNERIAEFLQSAEAAFKRGDWLSPENENAIYYADAVLAIQPENADALLLRTQVRTALLKQAEAALTRSDIASAQTLYNAILQRFPGDEYASQGALQVAQTLEMRRGQVANLLSNAQTAFSFGRLIEPTGASAYFYVSQALAIDHTNEQARFLRGRIRRALHESLSETLRSSATAQVCDQLRKLTRLFPEDQEFAAQFKRLVHLTASSSKAENQSKQPPLPGVFSTFARLEKESPSLEEPGTLSVNASGVHFSPTASGESISIPLSQIAELRSESDRIFLKIDERQYRFRCTSAQEFVHIFHSSVSALESVSGPKK